MDAIEKGIRDPLEWIFGHVLDEDKSGFIEQREAAWVAKALGYGKGERGDVNVVWSQMMTDMDSNKDGKISADEFVIFMADKYCTRPELAAMLKDELTNKKSQRDALMAAYAAPDDDLEEETLLDDSAAAAEPAAPPPAPAAPPSDFLKRPSALSDAKRKELERRFRELDEDLSGTLTRSEVADVLLLDEGADATLDEVWKVADTDSDGSITFTEFCNAVGAFDKLMAESDTSLPGL